MIGERGRGVLEDKEHVDVDIEMVDVQTPAVNAIIAIPVRRFLTMYGRRARRRAFPCR